MTGYLRLNIWADRIKPLLVSLAVMVWSGAWLFLLLSLPEDDWYIKHADIFDVIAEWMVRVGAFTQTGFVLLWMTLPWWRRAVTRAIMVKSFGLMLLIDYSALSHFLPAYVEAAMVGLIIVAVVIGGSISQFATLAWKMWHARREAEPVQYLVKRDDLPDNYVRRDR